MTDNAKKIKFALRIFKANLVFVLRKKRVIFFLPARVIANVRLMRSAIFLKEMNLDIVLLRECNLVKQTMTVMMVLVVRLLIMMRTTVFLNILPVKIPLTVEMA